MIRVQLETQFSCGGCSRAAGQPPTTGPKADKGVRKDTSARRDRDSATSILGNGQVAPPLAFWGFLVFWLDKGNETFEAYLHCNIPSMLPGGGICAVLCCVFVLVLLYFACQSNVAWGWMCMYSTLRVPPPYMHWDYVEYSAEK